MAPRNEPLAAIKSRRNNALNALVLGVPYIRWMGIRFDRRGDELTATRPFDEKLIVAHVAVSQAEPIKHVMKRSGPEYICEWNEYYQPLLPMPWCDKPPKRP